MEESEYFLSRRLATTALMRVARLTGAAFRPYSIRAISSLHSLMITPPAATGVEAMTGLHCVTAGALKAIADAVGPSDFAYHLVDSCKMVLRIAEARPTAACCTVLCLMNNYTSNTLQRLFPGQEMTTLVSRCVPLITACAKDLAYVDDDDGNNKLDASMFLVAEGDVSTGGCLLLASVLLNVASPTDFLNHFQAFHDFLTPLLNRRRLPFVVDTAALLLMLLLAVARIAVWSFTYLEDQLPN